jgi:NADPH:quinone reductase-like Zn-dependent oxidoreductase
MLHRKARVKRGQTIVVHGANSGVGGILVQLAHHAYLHFIGTAAPHHHDALRAAGVEPVDYNDQDLAGRVRQLAPRGVDAIFDNVGGPVMFASYRMLGPRGALVCYVIASMMKDTGSLVRPFMKALAQLAIWNTLPNGRTATFYNVWSGYGLRPATFRSHLREDLRRVFGLLANGTITPNVAARYPLAEASAAMALAESRTVYEKVILVP